MCIPVAILASFVYLFIPHLGFGQKPVRPLKEMRITPASGGVEIDEIRIERRTALGAVPQADLTNMYIKLWFPAKWTTQTDRFPHLIRFHSLAPIEDDTGRLLSAKGRMDEIEFLQGDVRGREWKSAGGKAGPVAGFLLDAPIRRANTIKAIKGKVEVSLVRMIKLTFEDLKAINGKVLEYPDMKSLKDLKLQFEIEARDGDVFAKIKAPGNYASSRNRGRLDGWSMLDGEKEVGVSSEHVKSQGNGVTVEKGKYNRRDFKGWSLHLSVLEPVETKTFEFEFKAIPLP